MNGPGGGEPQRQPQWLASRGGKRWHCAPAFSEGSGQDWCASYNAEHQLSLRSAWGQLLDDKTGDQVQACTFVTLNDMGWTYYMGTLNDIGSLQEGKGQQETVGQTHRV
jgi:hypothetical protein